MARKPRSGLDYFAVDTSLDLSMRLLMHRFGPEGFGTVLLLEQMIFREGYACSWNNDTEALFIAESRISAESFARIMEYCFDQDIFSKAMLNKHGVLTSSEIQQQWQRTCESCRRKNCTIDPELDLSLEDPFHRNLPEDYERLPKITEKSGNMQEIFRQRISSKERKDNGIIQELSTGMTGEIDRLVEKLVESKGVRLARGQADTHTGRS